MQITAAPVGGIPAAATNSVNLLASAVPPPAGEGDGWMGGFAWRSETCPTWQGFNPCAELTEGPEPGGDSINYARPVAYRVSDKCPTRQGGPDRDRLTRKAGAVADYVVARELWTGELSDLDAYDVPDGNGGLIADQANGRLASATADVLPAQTGVMTALGLLESAARDALAGQQVVIHAPLEMVGPVAMNLRRVGNELRTATDAIVIPDGGYPGTGPDGTGSGWMYATGPVMVRLGPVIVEDAPSTMERAMNLRTYWASRLFAATFDECAHFAIQVTSGQ